MADYDVGYGKPPKHGRYKKGESGNPRGRPKRPRHAMPKAHEERMKAIMFQEAYRLIEIQEGGKKTRLPLIQVIIRRLGVSAAQGRSRAMRYFMDMLHSIEEGNFAAYSACLKTMIDYKLDVGQDFEHCKKLNPSEPDPIPHPDDIIIDTPTGTFEVRGPMTKDEKVWWDRIEDTEAEIAELEQMLAEDPKNKFLEEELAHAREVRKFCARAVPDYKPRPSRRGDRNAKRIAQFRKMCADLDKPKAKNSERICTEAADGDEK
jgi:uncharacterized protein DUF5681